MLVKLLKSKSLLILTTLSLNLISFCAPATASQVQCNISFTQAAGLIEVLAIVSKPESDIPYNYTMNVESLSNGSSSKSTQSGKINLTNHSENTVLSRSVIGLKQNGSINAILKITDLNGAEICKSHEVYNNPKTTDQQDNEGEQKI